MRKLVIAVVALVALVAAATSGADGNGVTWTVSGNTATSPDGNPVAVNYTVTADGTTGSLTPSCDPPSGSDFSVGDTTVNCSVTDGTTPDTHQFTVTVSPPAPPPDTTKPVVTVPSNISTTTTNPLGKAVTFTATANDNVDGALTPTCNPSSGSTFPLGTTSVTCTATDQAGNTGSASFTVTVTLLDTTPPVITVPGPITVAATGPTTPVTYSVSATDNVDGSVAVSCAPTSGSSFSVGTTTVNCSAKDTAGNTGTASFTVTVQDRAAPVITVPSNQTVAATSNKGAVVTYSAQAVDNVDGPVTPSCSPASGSTFPAKATTTVTCTARDAAGNSDSKSFTVTVSDSAPTFTVVPNITVEANGPSGSTVTYTAPSASDIVDGGLPVTCTPASGAMFPLGATTVNCSATNSSNQTGTTSFGVLVRDTTPPVLSVPGKLSLQSDSPVPATNPLIAAFLREYATDLVDPRPHVVSTAPSVFPFGQTTVTFTATDSSGNSTKASGIVEVIQATAAPAPVVTPGTKPPERTPPGNVQKMSVQVSGRSVILRWRSPGGDFDHVLISRSRSGRKPVTVYRGNATRFVDRRVTPGVSYRYLVVAVDHTGNQSPGVVALARPLKQQLVGPAPGQRVSAPVILRWQSVAGATFYNVQVFRGKKKVLSTWPNKGKLILRSEWSYSGHARQLLPGRYTWYVWPARGTRKAPKYQRLEGFSSFLVVAA
jgi:hypothetical protein